MNIWAKALEVCGVIGIGIALAWWLVPTAAVISVTGQQFSSSQIVFSRTVPFDVWMEWSYEIRMPTGRECHSAGSAMIQAKTQRVIVATPPPLVSCLRMAGPKEVSSEFRAKILGIRLRPLYPPVVVIQE